jgi:hypothetical protein
MNIISSLQKEKNSGNILINRLGEFTSYEKVFKQLLPLYTELLKGGKCVNKTFEEFSSSYINNNYLSIDDLLNFITDKLNSIQ